MDVMYRELPPADGRVLAMGLLQGPKRLRVPGFEVPLGPFGDP